MLNFWKFHFVLNPKIAATFFVFQFNKWSYFIKESKPSTAVDMGFAEICTT